MVLSAGSDTGRSAGSVRTWLPELSLQSFWFSLK
jgi:hypothetical protein